MRAAERLIFDKEVATKAQGRYKVRVFDANDNLVYDQGEWKPNLILDCGLDKVAYMPWANVFQFAVCGTGTEATKIETSSNASQSGTTVTINSGAFEFTAGHVGKLIYWPGSDKYAKITGFTSAASVQVDVSQTVSSSLFLIYNVDQTELDQPYSMQCRYVPGSGLCGTEITNNTVKLLRTFDFYLETTPVLITEVGFKDQPASEKLFSRVVLQEPQYLAAGQYFQISYELSVTLEPGTATSRTVDVSGWPIGPSTSVSGVEMIQSIGMAVVDLSGMTVPYDRSYCCNEPFAPGTWYLGPEYGYTNRWKNGTAYPTKIYPALSANPFAFNRNYVDYYLNSDSGSYVPRVSAGVYNGTTTSQTSALVNTYNVVGNWPQQLLALSADYMVPVVEVPVQWGKVSATAQTSAITMTPEMSGYLNVFLVSAFTGTGDPVNVTIRWNTVFKSDIQAQIVANTNMATVASPFLGSSSGGVSGVTFQQFTNTCLSGVLSAYFEDYPTSVSLYRWLMPPYDPYTEFPNPVRSAEFPWGNWTHVWSGSAEELVTGSSVFMSTVSTAPTTFGSAVDRSAVNVEIPLTIVPYVSGSFERIKKATFLTNLGNRNDWRTIGVGPTDTSINVTDRVTASRYNGYVYVFDEPQTKLSTHILNVFFKYTWRRDLST